MLLRKLGKVSVTNNLSESITGVNILYGEAKGVLPGLIRRIQDRIIDVDVEVSKNILWTRTVSFGGVVIPSSGTHSTSAERICFGDNDGYWQIYFTYKGDEYKLENNKCKMNLSPQCDANDLEIHLFESPKGGVKLILKVSYLVTSEFNVIKGKPAEKTIKISIKNQLETSIDHVYVVLTEEISSSKNATPRTQKVNFDPIPIKSGEVSTSLEFVPFNCFGFYHYLSICFTSEGYCYESVSKRETGNYIKLTYADYGNALFITVSRIAQDTKEDVFIKFEAISCRKSRPASKKESEKERKAKIEEMVLEVRKNDAICDSFAQLKMGLKRLSKIITEDNEVQKCKESHFLFNKCDDRINFPVDDTVKGENLRIPENMKIHHVTLKADMDYIRDSLDNFKANWNDLKESFIPLKRLVESVNPNEDAAIGRIKEDLLMVNSMCIIDAVCNVFLLSGLSEEGLTFYTSNSNSAREVSVEPTNLALAIEEELQLWKSSVFSRETKRPGCTTKNVENDEEMTVKLMTYSNTLMRLTKLFVLIRDELIQRIMEISLKLQSKNRNVNISKLTSFTMSAVAGGITLAGLLAAPFTAGASLVLVASGVGIGATSGALAVGTTITDGVLTSKYLYSTISLAENNIKLGNMMAELQTLIEKHKEPIQNLMSKVNARRSDSSVKDGDSFLKSVDALKTTFTQVGAVFGLFGDDIFFRNGIQVAMSSTLRLGFAVTGLIFDLVFLTLNLVNIGRGPHRSELIYKLESDALSLEQELKDNKLDHLI